MEQGMTRMLIQILTCEATSSLVATLEMQLALFNKTKSNHTHIHFQHSLRFSLTKILPDQVITLCLMMMDFRPSTFSLPVVRKVALRTHTSTTSSNIEP